MKLDGKVAIVTGCASGIGRAIARRFAAEGARLVIADIWEDRLQALGRELEDEGAAVTAVATDVSRDDQVVRMVEAAVSELGGLDVLCNNAGVLDALTPLAEVSDELWQRIMGVNLNGPFFAIRRALPVMLERGGGAIVNTASAAGLRGGRGGAAYTTSKHALVGLTRSVAWYYGPQGIRCNAVAPGTIKTRMAMGTDLHPGGLARYEPYFPAIPPPGSAKEVADVVTFLASEESRYINGAVVPVDGGWMSY